MKRVVISALYVGSGMAASFLVVVLLSRAAGPEGRPGFFLFLALYFPLVALLSQTYSLLRYRASAPGRLGLAVDAGLFLLAAGILTVAGRSYFGTGAALIYAASIPLTYRATARLAAIQFASGTDMRVAMVPLGAALARIALAGLAIGLALPVEWAMLLSTAGLLAVTMLAPSGARGDDTPPLAGVGHKAFLAFTGYFLVTSFTFQWDRFVFSGLGDEALVVAAGICMTWVLSPISGIYGVLSRAAAPQIFAAAGPAPDGQILRRRFLRRGAEFTGAALLYSALLGLLWQPLNAVAFPFYDGGVSPALILCGAMILDRLAILALFMRNAPRVYAVAGLCKLATITASIAIVLALPGLQTLVGAFGIYLVSSALYLLTVVWLAGMLRPRDA